jgi:hypothetical protein
MRATPRYTCELGLGALHDSQVCDTSLATCIRKSMYTTCFARHALVEAVLTRLARGNEVFIAHYSISDDIVYESEWHEAVPERPWLFLLTERSINQHGWRMFTLRLTVDPTLALISHVSLLCFP